MKDKQNKPESEWIPEGMDIDEPGMHIHKETGMIINNRGMEGPAILCTLLFSGLLVYLGYVIYKLLI